MNTTTTAASPATAMNQFIAEHQAEHHGELGVERRGLLVRRSLVGGVEILTRRLRRELERNTHAGDTVRFCLRGELGHALVCLDDRLLILKRGFHAGTTFGAMAATIFYPDVTGIQVRMHIVSGWIEISSPSFQGSERRRLGRSRGAERDVFRQPNCVPIQRRHMRAYQGALTELRRLVAEAKLEPEARLGPDHTGIVDQLERLAVLRRQGLLDEREFTAAKAKLVGGVDSRTAHEASPLAESA
jgi:hypothetical protein